VSLLSLPKMLFSDKEGWPELLRIHPSVTKWFVAFVIPLSLIPPAMFAYSALAHPGSVFPVMEPPMTRPEVLAVALIFFGAELVMVPLMASLIQQMGDVVDVRPAYEDAFTLAAVAPTPLWLAPLALFVPNVWANVVVLALAWIGCAALIRHGVRPLFQLENQTKSHLMANFIIMAGVMAWIALMVVLVMLLSVIMGWR
jgi:Yip1-like protein